MNIARQLATTALALTCACAVAVGCNRGGEGEAGDEPVIDEGSAPAEPAPADEAEPEAAAPEADEPEAAPTPAPAAQITPRVVERRPDVEANRELAERLGLAPPPPLIVADLMTRADVRELTGYTGELLETSLEGIEPSVDYNAIRIGAGQGYGFALQLWQLPEIRQVTNQFRRLRETYFAADNESAPVGNEAFSATFQGLRHYAFLHRASRSIAVVTCQEDLCDPAEVRSLAQRVSNRL